MSIPISDKAGFGTMSLTWRPDPKPVEESAKTIQYVTSTYGVKFINAGEFYGADNINLKLVKEFLSKEEHPEQYIISIKGGINNGPVTGDKYNVTKSIDNIITFFAPVGDSKRPKIIYEQARVDPNYPQEKTIGYIQEYVKNGKIDGISLSEASAKTISISADTAPISGVEVEVSLMSLDIFHNGVLAEATKRGIPIIAYSPIGRGQLTDYAVENSSTFLNSLAPGDMRSHFDRFSPENFENNLVLLKKLYAFAHDKKGISLEALALSWITSISDSNSIYGKVGQIIPIPSGSTPARIDSNYGNIVKLSDEDLEEIKKLIDDHEIKGLRYNSAMEGGLFR